MTTATDTAEWHDWNGGLPMTETRTDPLADAMEAMCLAEWATWPHLSEDERNLRRHRMRQRLLAALPKIEAPPHWSNTARAEWVYRRNQIIQESTR